MLQVCEMRKHALVEAHVRVYTVRKDLDHLATGSVAYFQPFAMRLQHPDDELGGMLMMNLPNIVVHALDAWSPLVPHPMDLRLWRGPATEPDDKDEEYNPAADCRFPDVLQRGIESDQGARDSITCQFCGEAFWARQQLERHMQYCTTADAIGGWDPSLACRRCGEVFPSRSSLRRHYASSEECEAPAEPWHGEDDAEAKMYNRNRHRVGGRQESVGGDAVCESRELIEAWLRETQAEIVVLVEGIDATTSATIQSRHSYRWDELVWDATFAQTVFPTASGGCRIDFTQFNDLLPLQRNGKPLVPEHGQSLPIGLAPGKALQYAWSKNCTIHVGGLQGDLEDEANLAAMLQRFGTVLVATVRYRREPATETSPAKVSWALVTFSKTAEMQAALVGEHDGAPFL